MAFVYTVGPAGPGLLPMPLYPADYRLVGKWTPQGCDAVAIDVPFPIRTPWTELEF